MRSRKDKRAIVVGAADGIPSQAICQALRECDIKVLFSINQYFV
jgi:hypothetical protein